MEKYHKKWKKLAKNQSKFIYTTDADYIKNAAQILSDAYDLDKLDCIDIKECFLCHEEAKKRCSKCKEAWYCGRYKSFQLLHSYIHQVVALQISKIYKLSIFLIFILMNILILNMKNLN